MEYKKTKFLLCLVVFSAPLYVIRFHLGPFPTTLLEVLILLTTLSWILESRFWTSQNDGNPSQNRFEKNGLFRLPVTSYQLPTLLFLLSASIAFLISSDKHNAFGTLKAYVIEPILIYMIITTVIKTKKDTEKLIVAMIASGVLVSLWIIVQAAFGLFITNPTEAMLGRAHGPYNTANAVGLYLGPIFALALAFLSSVILTPSTRGKDLPRMRDLASARDSSSLSLLRMTAGVGVVALLLIAILLSHSTGALIATTAVIFCFFAFIRHPDPEHSGEGSPAHAGSGIRQRFFVAKAPQNDGRWATVALISYSLISLILFFFIVPKLTPKTSWTKVRPENYTTTTIRLCLWEGTGSMLLERPIFGAGLSGFKELYAAEYTTCDSEPLEYPHNLILNFWTEMGILGMISFMWLVWRVSSPVILRERSDRRISCEASSLSKGRCKRSVLDRVLRQAERSFANAQGDGSLRLGITLAVIYILIHGLVDVPYFKNDLSLQFWLLLALSEFQTKKEPNSAD